MPISNNILAGSGQGSAADLGEEIAHSLRFNASGFLTRGQLSTGDGLLANDRTFTFSTWFKHGQMGETNIFGIHPSSGNDNWLISFAEFSPNPSFAGRDTSNGWMKYSQASAFRDPNAWYHLFLVCDAGDLSLRVNNILQNQESQQNHSMDRDFVIGAEGNSGSTPMTGYLAETYFFQGSILHAENNHFIRKNDNGIWVPDTPTKTNGDAFTASDYGTNGWHLTYNPAGKAGQTGNGAGIGADHSPNNNHFTPSGFDVSAVTANNPHNDLIKDSPTNNWTTLNNLNTTNSVTLTGANLFYAQSANSQGASASQELRSGKWYFEVQKSANHNPEIGIMPIEDRFTGLSSSFTGNFIAVVTNNQSIIRDGTGNTDSVNYTAMTGQGVIGCAIDMDAKKIWWTDLDGNWQASGNPATGANPGLDFTGLDCADGCTPHIQIHTSDAHSVFVKFGQMDFVHTPPEGFKAIQANEQPEPTIKDGRDHFGVLTYNGSTNAQSVTGLEFTPDFVWIKERNGNEDHFLTDSVRGAGKHVRSNAADTEVDSSATLTQFINGGFDLTTAGAAAPQVNSSTNTYVAWCWKAGTSFTPTVTNYTNASASINRKAGFGIYKLTGTNQSGSSFTHGLNSRPEMVFAKRLDNANDWVVLGPTTSSVALAPTDTFRRLNEESTVSKGSNVLTAIDDTSLTFDSFGEVAAAGNYIFYCWHSVPGYSKIGRYDGNGSTNGTFVYTGFKPAFIFYYRLDQGGPLMLVDSKRAPENPHTTDLIANSGAEIGASTNAHIDLLSNGFKLRNNSVDRNSSTSAQYAYMAFAEHPFVGENAAPSTAR